MRGRKTLPAAIALAAATLAGCGSTVHLGALPQTADGISDLSGLGGPTTAPDSSGAGSQGISPTSGATTPDEGATPAEATGSTDAPASVPTATTGSGSLGPIKIGGMTVQGAGSFQASLGFSGATGDQIAMTKSVVNYINAHGGLGGRKIELVAYDIDPNAAASDEAAAMQAACTFFTQDNKVTAVASYAALLPESFYQCMAKAHVPVITPDEGVSTDFFKRYPNTLYMPPGPTYTRLLNDSVDALWDAGWLTSKSTVGIVSYDTNDAHTIVNKGLVPALQRHGLKIAAGMYTGTTTAAASEYVGGVLSFKNKHVDRVFFAPGGQPIYFALIAAQQGYHPRYELGSLEYPTVVSQNLPNDQMSGAMGLDWLPYLDLPSNKWGTVTTPGIAECRKAMAAANQDYSGTTTLAVAAWICDDWMFIRDVFKAGATTDESGFRRAAEALGDGFKPASTFRTSFAPGRTHDGAAAYRLIAFQDSCKCFSYTSPIRPLA